MPSPPNPVAPTWYDAFWANLDAVIAATWPDVVGKLWLDNQLERRDWTNLLNDGEMEPPWAVVRITAAPGTLGITIPHVDLTVVVTFIENIAAAGDQSERTGPRTTASSYAMRQIQTLNLAVLRATTLGTVDDGVSFDASAELSTNDVFIEQGLDYQAASLTFTSHAITV